MRRPYWSSGQQQLSLPLPTFRYRIRAIDERKVVWTHRTIPIAMQGSVSGNRMPSPYGTKAKKREENNIKFTNSIAINLGSISKFYNGFHFIYLSHGNISFHGCIVCIVRDNGRMHIAQRIERHKKASIDAFIVLQLWTLMTVCLARALAMPKMVPGKITLNSESTKSILHFTACVCVHSIRHKWWSKRVHRCIFKHQLHAHRHTESMRNVYNLV